jgi:N-acetylglucosamine-6-phosphate deacetylase
MVRAKTDERCLLVTDAVMCAGCPPGRYRLGALEVELGATGRVAAPGAATLAGSALTMPEAVARTCRFTGLPIERVLEMASARPAAYLADAPRGRLDLEWDEASGSVRVERVRD